jgi:hypothetical protein
MDLADKAKVQPKVRHWVIAAQMDQSVMRGEEEVLRR